MWCMSPMVMAQVTALLTSRPTPAIAKSLQTLQADHLKAVTTILAERLPSWTSLA